jgi:uncharacterized protein YjiS (DUF1127 family)
MLKTVSGHLELRGRPSTERRAAVDDSLDRAIRTIAICLQRSRTRRALAELSDHSLRDIGLSRADVLQEIRKPFWR